MKCRGKKKLLEVQPKCSGEADWDTAVEEAVYLTKYGSHVHLLVRRDALRASKAMADRASNHRNITIHYNTAVEDAYGDQACA